MCTDNEQKIMRITPPEIEEKFENLSKLVFYKSENYNDYKEELIKQIHASKKNISVEYKAYFNKYPNKLLSSNFEPFGIVTREMLAKHLDTGEKRDVIIVFQLMKSIDIIIEISPHEILKFVPSFLTYFTKDEYGTYIRTVKAIESKKIKTNSKFSN